MKMEIIIILGIAIIAFCYCYSLKKDAEFYENQFKKLVTTNDTFLVVKYYLDEDGKARAREEKVRILPETSYELWLKDGVDLKGIHILRNVQ